MELMPAEPTPTAEFATRRITQSTRVDNNFAFRIDVILPGTTLRLEPEADTIRLCWLVTGKVVVKVCSEEPFVIGFSGMFKLLPGFAAEVVNLVEIDAVLHVSSISQRV